jgi:hypothetical protein
LASRDRKKPDRLSTDGLIRRRDYPEAHTLPRHIHISCLNMTSAVFNLASNDNSRRAFPNSKFCERHKSHARFFLSAPTNKNRAYRISFENLLRSIEPVKIAFRWRILNDMTLVRNELRIKASWYTDISIFSVAIEARIWLYVGLCCDAGGPDGVTVPAVATHRIFRHE